MPTGRETVITGLGAVSPLGVGVRAYWEALLAGNSGIGILPHRNPESSAGRDSVGGFIRDFDPKAHVRPRKTLKVMSRELQTAFAAAVMAYRDSALEAYLESQSNFDRQRIGTVFGSEMLYGSPGELSDTIREAASPGQVASLPAYGPAAMKHIYPLWMLKYLPNMAACHVGIAVRALGPNNTIVLGDSSAPAALIESISCIDRGIADVMFTGATGNNVNESGILYRGSVPLGSIRDPLEDSSIPFGGSRDGAIGGEAAAAMLVESAEHAAARKATPLARIAGSAVRFIPAEGRGSPAAIAAVIEAACDQAAVRAADLGAVVSFGVGDPLQDRAEQQVLAAVLPEVPVTAPVAAIGHCGAASGSIHLVTAVLMLLHRQIPPTRTADQVPDAEPVNVCMRVRPLERDSVLVLTHTPQGHAAAIVLAAA